MTGQLIKDDVLQGKVDIPMRNGKKHNASWSDQLSLLLSNKTTIIRKSTPKLTIAAFWGIGIVALFAVCSLVAGQLIDTTENFKCFWRIDAIPIALALMVAGVYHYKDGSFENIFRMVDHTSNDTIDEEYTSSEEPSVAEFKNWMGAISNYLGGDNKRQYKKLVIVFDNMDRLPSEKVMQLWSSIYSFFAGGECVNIWVVIPYDYKHLCEAIYGSVSDEEQEAQDADRIKQFISQTFPITYHVPQPVITDYKELFYTYFDQAFGAKEHDREHICQVYMHLNSTPNPRTVIRFVNELVAMRLQWSAAKYRLQNMALYILKKYYILYEGEGQDAQLLSDGLFEKVAPFYPETDKVRTELCQYAYGLEDENLARELPLRNELKRRLEAGESVSDYVMHPSFMTVFEEVLSYTDQSTLDKTVKSMTSLDGVELSADVRERVLGKWDLLANLKSKSRYDKNEYDETLSVLINHATARRVNDMAKSFAKAMQKVEVNDGVAYYKVQNKLQEALKEVNVEYDDADWYQRTLCSAEQFVQYVCEAKEGYAHYGLTCDMEELNTYLLNGAVSGNDAVTSVVNSIKDDEKYNLSKLQDGLINAIRKDNIKGNITVAAYIHRVLNKEEGKLEVRLSKEMVTEYINGNNTSGTESQPKGLEDVVAMFMADGNDLNPIDDRMISRICECMGRYMDYTWVLKHTGTDGSAFRKLNVYCIEHKRGNHLDTKYAAEHLSELHTALGIDVPVMMKQFNRLRAVKWGELNVDSEYVRDVKKYVHQQLFSAYRDNPGTFTDSIIALGVAALGLQSEGFLVRQQQVQQGYNRIAVLTVDEYWKAFIDTYLGTKHLPEADEKLTGEAVTMLRWLYDRNEVREPELLDKILLHPHEATLKGHLHTMMNDHFIKTDISKEKFLYYGKLLPMLGADMDANTARGLMTHFVKPVCKDAECAVIIVGHKDFYLAVLKYDSAIAEAIAKEMAEMDAYFGIKEELEGMIKKDEVEEN